MTSRVPVSIHWPLSTYRGWGIFGVYLFVEWAADDEVLPATTQQFDRKRIVLDALRLQKLEPFLRDSERLQERILQENSSPVPIGCPLLEPMGNQFHAPTLHGVEVKGTPAIGVMVFENTAFSPAWVETLRQYPLIVTLSSWNAELLRAAGVERVQVVFQGADASLFHPAPRVGLCRDPFVILSAGKIELRKGQDIVLRAFRAFAQRDPESLPVTAGHRPGPGFEKERAVLSSIEPVPFAANGAVDVI